MPRRIGVDEARSMLHTRADLIRAGTTERELRHLEASGEVMRVRRGWYVTGSWWNGLWPEGRHLAVVLATMGEAGGGSGVASYGSAAVLHEAALHRARFGRVHVTVPPGLRSSSNAAVFRHAEALHDDDVVTIAGIPCTSLERTAYDLARLAEPESAVAFADAALGRAAVRKRVQDEDAAAAWRARMRERIAAAGSPRGARQARWVIEFADGRAELPLESVSRLHLQRLAFARPRVQVAVPGPDRGTYWVDLGLDDAGVWAEIDGRTKYLEETLRGGRSLEEVLLEEKRREDWIRGTTGRRIIRWGAQEAASASTLGAYLAACGVRPGR